MIRIRDPIYRTIEIEDEFLPLINNPYFQRLRNIRQNSLLYFVYPSAKHDRFTHSMGVYHLMRRVLNNENNAGISKEDQFALKAAALLHDIGHGPNSHLWEVLVENFDHEQMSSQIIREEFKLPQVADIIEKKHPLYPLLSSVIDVDKLDYMSRDSYFCGVGYGHTDMERIVESMHVIDKKIAIDAKVVSSVEHMITSRISLYKSTYYHHLVRAMDALLEKIFERVQYLRKNDKELYIDELLLNFMQGKGTVKDFVHLDDSVIRWHLFKWSQSKDPILKDLVTRFVYRGGFKALDPVVYGITKEEVLAAIGKSFDVNYYFYETPVKKTVYESEVLVKKKTGELVALSEFSPYIKNVISLPISAIYFIGPTEVMSEFKEHAKK
ncbi:MAG: HD domain-containing protein [Nanoarchaeota archaeon]|nr:HD domain-containing protein [Nanoarchaeota archaeon]